MRLVINILAILGLLLGIACVIELYGLRIGDAGPGGFGTVALPLWALIGAAMAVAFGFAGRIIDRRVPIPASKISDVSIAGGLLLGALIFALPFIFGS